MASARIVIADDDPAILQTMTLVLKEHGYDVGSATSGRELMTLLEERTPDLLLLDVMFSDVDGFQLLERIKNDDRWRDLPVLMISSLPPEEAAVKTLGDGIMLMYTSPSRAVSCSVAIQQGIERHNRRATQPLDTWLKHNGLIGISGVDTRLLTRCIRDHGPPSGAVAYHPDGQVDVAALRGKALDWPGLEGMDLAKEVTCRQTYEWAETVWDR